MATLNVAINGVTIGTVSKTFQAADADLLGWAMDAYGTDENGNPRTGTEAAQAALDALANGISANVNRWKKQAAAKTAEDGVAEVKLTEV